jgi:plastocyanin domain-containing protein
MKSKRIEHSELFVSVVISAVILAVIWLFFILISTISFSENQDQSTQEIKMIVTADGYSPNSFVLRQGVPVIWNIDVQELTGCNEILVAKEYGLRINLEEGKNVVKFIPDKSGTVQWSCSMNMLKGSFLVTETGQASQEQIASATPSKGSGCGCGGGR